MGSQSQASQQGYQLGVRLGVFLEAADVGQGGTI